MHSTTLACFVGLGAAIAVSSTLVRSPAAGATTPESAALVAYIGQQSLDPCSLDDAGFQSTDAGCRDMATGLVWSAASCEGGLGISPTNVTWKYWSNFVKNSTFGGHRWRLPTKAELLTLASHDDPLPEAPDFMTHINVTSYKYAQSSDAYRRVHWIVRLGDGDTQAADYAGEGLAVRVD